MGRHKQPAELKVVHGTYRKDRDPALKDLAGSPLTKLPEPPSMLRRMGKQRWRSVGKKLIASNLLRDTDLETLQVYCAAWDEFDQSEKDIAEHGAYVTTMTGGVRAHPALQRKQKAMEMIERIGRLFGLNAMSRSQVVAPKKQQRSGVQPRSREA